jgi:hypothetical protein
MKYRLLSTLYIMAIGSLSLSAAVCPSTANTNTDCGYLLTIGSGDVVTGAPVSGANPYDGADDALVGVINNSGATYSGSITLSGSGNGGGIFGFDGDGVCTYITASYCATAPTGYEGPLTTFTGISSDGTTGTVVFSGLAAGASTFFSLEGSPASIGSLGVSGGSAPEPGTIAMLGAGLAALGFVGYKRRARASIA